jgi:hypothetical protein
MPQDKQELPMRYHVAGLARGVQKWFRALSLPTRIVLALVTLYMLSLLVNMLMQAVLLSLGEVYTILGILASAIIIYEFLRPRYQKKR